MAAPIKIQILLDEHGVVKSVKQINQELKKTEKAGGDASKGINLSNKALKNMQQLLIGGGIVFLTRRLAGGLKNLAVDTANVAGRFEQMTISLETITKGRGVETFKELNAWAIRMPISTEAAVAGYTRMRAMGLTPTIADMTTLVDTTSALGGSSEIFNGIVLALGQIATKGKLMSQEIRQLAERGIPAYEILNEKLGITGEMLEKAGRKAIDGRAAIEALLEGMADRFAGQSARIREAYSGITTEIKSNYVEFQRLLLDEGPFSFVKGQLKDIRDGVAIMNAGLRAAQQLKEIKAILGAAGIKPEEKRRAVIVPLAFSDIKVFSQEQLSLGAKIRSETIAFNKQVQDIQDKTEKARKASFKLDTGDDATKRHKINRDILRKEFDKNVKEEKRRKKDQADFDARIVKESTDKAKKAAEILDGLNTQIAENKISLTKEGFDREIAFSQLRFDKEFGMLEANNDLRIAAEIVLNQQIEMINGDRADQERQDAQDRIDDIMRVGDAWAGMFIRAEAASGNFFENLRDEIAQTAKRRGIAAIIGAVIGTATGIGPVAGAQIGAGLGDFLPSAGKPVFRPSIPQSASSASTVNTNAIQTQGLQSAGKQAGTTIIMNNTFNGITNSQELAETINSLATDRRIGEKNAESDF